MSVTETNAGSAASQRRWALAILAGATVACLGPFIAKAFCIDDPLFLWGGRQIQSHPFDFFGFDVNWEGYAEPMYANTKNPPLGCYFIALAATLLGWSEPALHGAFLLPAIGAIWGTWYVARSLCRQPVAAALATLSTPVFLVSSTNVMCDTLALCSYVWAIGLWIKWLDSNRIGWLLLASFLVAVSALTKYFGVSLIFLLTAYTLLRDHRTAWKLICMLLPVAILAGYQQWTLETYQRGLLLDAVDFASSARAEMKPLFWQQTLSLLCFSGGCLLPAGFCAPWILPKRWLVWGALLAAALAFNLYAIKPREIQAFRETAVFHAELAAQIGLFCIVGVIVMWLALDDLWRRRDADSALLALWLFGTAVFAGYVNWTCNGRSILPMAPVVGILLARQFDDRYHATAANRKRWAWSLASALAVGLMVTWSDYWLAETARTATASITDFCRGQQRTLWLQGHWGFQWYMEAAGAKSMDFRHPLLKKGDLLAVPSLHKSTATGIPRNEKEQVQLRRLIEIMACSWLTTLDSHVGAGFYASTYGPMPFVFGAFPPEYFSVHEILDEDAFVDKPQIERSRSATDETD
jgi:4-amino-4-deoxy-L-arabinose transferase-like glycosyltransferase